LNLNSKISFLNQNKHSVCLLHINSRQQLDDVQKVLSTEQIKFNEECSKLQHETHEKWMDVKRLTRELEVSKKECENLRKQYVIIINHWIRHAPSPRNSDSILPGD
jgi:hypothetical protein